MIFNQYYLECLSQASYLVGDETSGQAVVVDPRRDIEDYLADAKAKNLQIVGVICTHFHADFVSGHLELARESGAWIGFGDAATAEFDFRALSDGERISLGDVTLEIMTTPGHTPESISVIVREHADDEVPYGVLTGDALFIGDVGRPDLLASAGITAEELAAKLYDSVQRKLMSLPDATRVFPAHGAGSACGKNLSTERQSTIGQQRAMNYACQPMAEEDFIGIVTAGQPTAPAYFVYNATLNKHEHNVRDLDTHIPALTDEQVFRLLEKGAVLHDARTCDNFAVRHVKGAINVPSDGRMAETAGMIIAPDDPIVIMATPGEEQQVATRFARIGFDDVRGYIPDPEAFLARHAERAETSRRLNVEQADSARQDESVQLLDVRNPGEVADGMMPGAKNIPLAHLVERSTELSTGRPVLVYCAGGWRSSVAASTLRAQGFSNVSDIIGGYNAWREAYEPLHSA